MNLNEKQIDTFLNTLIKIIEDRENVTIDYSVKNRKEWWKMTIETKEMFEIIHANNKKQREFNKRRAKKIKKQNIINNIFMFVGSATFMFGLMFLINVVENLKF